MIIGEELYNAGFRRRSTLSVSTKWRRQCAQYTPEWAAPITGIPAETIRRIAREFAAAAPHALAHNGWRTSNFINSFQTERAITILNALVGQLGRQMLLPAAGEGGGLAGQAAAAAVPARFGAMRLDGVPWKYPFVPLKMGVFQQLRDSDRSTGQPYHGARLVHLPPEPGDLAAGSRPDAGGDRARWISSLWSTSS